MTNNNGEIKRYGVWTLAAILGDSQSHVEFVITCCHEKGLGSFSAGDGARSVTACVNPKIRASPHHEWKIHQAKLR